MIFVTFDKEKSLKEGHAHLETHTNGN